MKKITKKSSQKKNKKSSSRSTQKRVVDNATLNDFGLEPPKIYRDSQRKISQEIERHQNNSTNNKSRQSKKSNLTNAEKRTKQTKKRKKKNKLRKIVISVLVVILVIALTVTIALTAFFHITEFKITGSEVYSAEEIENHFTVKIGDSLFLSDFDKAVDNLQLNMPYVYKAVVSRKLPSTVEIKITDATVAYSIKNADKTYTLLDDNFKVLETEAEKSQGIIIKKAKIESAVLGEKIAFSDEDVSNCLTTLAKSIKSNNFTEITSIYSNGKNDNYVVYDKRITFKLGSCDDVDTKIYQGLASCEKLNQSSPNAKGEMNITSGKQIYFTEK